MTASRFAISLLWLGSLAACGAGAERPVTENSEGGEIPTATAREALEACRRAAPSAPTWSLEAPYDALVERARAHLASLTVARDVTAEEVQRIADAVWAFLDEATFETENESLRTNAEDAAEGLLRERGRGQSVAAAQHVLDAVLAIGAAFRPTTVDPCADEAARADAERRADGGA